MLSLGLCDTKNAEDVNIKDVLAAEGYGVLTRPQQVAPDEQAPADDRTGDIDRCAVIQRCSFVAYPQIASHVYAESD